MVDLHEHEHIIHTVRVHWFVIIIRAIMIGTVGLLPLVSYLVARVFNIITITGDGSTLIILACTIWLLFAWISFFFVWTDYFLDMWIITNQRIIDIEQKGVFNRRISTLHIENIQDTTIEVTGILATMLSIGNIHIQTAGSEKEFIMHDIHNPHHTRQIIMDAYEKANS